MGFLVAGFSGFGGDSWTLGGGRASSILMGFLVVGFSGFGGDSWTLGGGSASLRSSQCGMRIFLASSTLWQHAWPASTMSQEETSAGVATMRIALCI
jgi:hypothetical protein